MNNLTVTTKLRFVAAIAPAILLLVAIAVAVALRAMGRVPREIYENQYAAVRAAEGMENALYKMDWGRAQPDGAQITVDQQRRFIDYIQTANAHIVSREQAEKIEAIANTARPLFETIRKAQPGDDTFQPKLRELEGMVAELVGIDDAALLTIASSAESQARIMILVLIVGAVAVPWICFLIIARMTAGIHLELKEVRRRLEDIAARQPATSDETRTIDQALTRLGYPKPNPMLAE